MNCVYFCGTACFMLTILLLWSTCIGEADDDPNSKKYVPTEGENATATQDTSHENGTTASSTTSETQSSKSIFEDDLMSEIIRPTVAPATPQEELMSSVMDSLPEALSPDSKLLFPQRSVLPALNTLDSVEIVGSPKEESSTSFVSLKGGKSARPSAQQSSSIKVETSFLLIPKVISDEPDKKVASESVKETPINNEHAIAAQQKLVEKEKPDVHNDHLETFAEWREKQGLKTKNDKVLTVPKTKAKSSSQRKKVNYASADCGAKVVASNSEATNLGAMLSENKDIYMLSPCQSKTWFIIELCEKIQADLIEIANYELFSSTPKDFNVHASTRNPSRDWQLLGKFNAKDERQVQGFAIEGKHYAKFVKVEMLSHFGSEHYCPISLFRVFGTSEVDEFEESENSESDHDSSESDSDEAVPLADSKETSSKDSFIENAKDVVFGMVSKAVESLTKKASQNDTIPVAVDSESEKKDSINEEVLPNKTNTLENVSTLYHKSDSQEVNVSIVVPLKDESEEDSAELHHLKMNTLILKPHVSNSTCLNSALLMFFPLIVIKRQCLVDKFRPKRRIAHKLSYDKATLTSSNGSLSNNATRSAGSSVATEHTRDKIVNEPKSSEASMATDSLDQSIVQPLLNNDSDGSNTNADEHKNDDQVRSIAADSDDTQIGEGKLSEDSREHPPSRFKDNEKDSSLAGLKDKDSHQGYSKEEKSTLKGKDVDVLEFAGYENEKREGRAVKILTPESSSSSVENVTLDSTVHVQPKSSVEPTAKLSVELTERKISIGSAQLGVTVSVTQSNGVDHTDLGREVDIISHNRTEESTKDNLGVTPTLKIAPTPTSHQNIKVPDQEESADKSTTYIKNVDSSATDPSTLLQDGVPLKVNFAKPVSECSTQGWSATISTGAPGGTKESFLVKLKTHIRQLEANLTLSTQYLEQMSQKYKTAMEEQRKKFEKKLSVFNQSLHKAETQIEDLKRENKRFSQTVSAFQKELDSVRKMMKQQNEQIAENYVFLVLVQIIVTMVIVWTCRPKRAANLQHLSLQRRSSEPSIHLYHNGSVRASPTTSTHSVPSLEECMKEESSPSKQIMMPLSIASKRKRQKRKLKLLDCNRTLEDAKPSRTILSKTAGLLFSAGKGLLSGIAGAFSPTYPKQCGVAASRSTEALVGEFTGSIPHHVRRTKSSDLAMISEMDDDVLPQRPRSCDDLLLSRNTLSNGSFHFNKRSGKQSG